jgi:hypothetical protein
MTAAHPERLFYFCGPEHRPERPVDGCIEQVRANFAMTMMAICFNLKRLVYSGVEVPRLNS